VKMLRLRYEARIRSGERPRAGANGAEDASPPASASAESDAFGTLQLQAVAAQRAALMDLRDRDVIGDDAFHAVEEEIDLLELAADERLSPDLDEQIEKHSQKHAR
jgi:hypothetical protein